MWTDPRIKWMVESDKGKESNKQIRFKWLAIICINKYLKVPKTNKHHVGSIRFFCSCSFRLTDVRVRAHFVHWRKTIVSPETQSTNEYETKLKRKTMTKKSFMLREIKSWNNNVLLKLISDSESEAFISASSSSSVRKYSVITTHRCLMLNAQRYSSRWNDLIETSALRCWNDHIVSDGIFCRPFTCTDWTVLELLFIMIIKRWQLIFGSCPYIHFYLLISSGAHSLGVW